MIQPEDKISYGYLNLDEKKFYATQSELIKSTGNGSFVRAIPNYNHGQVLITAAAKEFSECLAIITCKRLTGVLK